MLPRTFCHDRNVSLADEDVWWSIIIISTDFSVYSPMPRTATEQRVRALTKVVVICIRNGKQVVLIECDYNGVTIPPN